MLRHPWLFAGFVVAPAVELGVAVWVGRAIGAGWLLGWFLAAVVVGLWAMRRAGAVWWRELRRGHLEGRLPGGRAVADAALQFAGGLLLALPGLVSDVAGLLLLVPPVRDAVRLSGQAWFVRRFTAVTGPGGATVWTRRTDVVRGEVVREDEGPGGAGGPPTGPPQLPPGS